MTAGDSQELQRRITDDNNGQYQQQNMDNSGNTGGNYTHAASESVVPDLMEVYDALTMSSTPQPGGMYPRYHQVRQECYGGHQILPPALPGNIRQSYRRSVKSGGSSDESYSDTTTGSKRKATGGNSKSSRSRKGKEDPKTKSTASDSRWSKRFTWPDELHRDFVAAVFEVGLKHSSPSSIMEHMKQNPDVTSERVKSHLQKYRLNRQKSRNEFMTSYDRALDGFKNNPHDFDDDGDHSFSCGEGAALLTHSVQTEATREGSQSSTGGNKGLPEQTPAPTQGGPPAQDSVGVSTLHLPLLSEEESQSPLGQTFGYLVGMFQTLSLELEMKRRAQDGDQPHQALLSPGNGQIPYHSTHHQSYSLEEAATAASFKFSDPSIYEIANAVPHAVATRDNAEAAAQYSGMYRDQSQAVHQDPSSQSAYAHQQGKHFVDPPPQASDNSAAHNSHRVPPQSNIPPPHQTSASTLSVSTQQSHSATQPSLVPCPLDASSASPGNASHSTGRTLQAQKESSIMKQDMKSQKAFQNKMRALKQVELNKYGGRENPTDELKAALQGDQYDHEAPAYQTYAPAGGEAYDDPAQAALDRNASHTPLPHENDGTDQDFWNSGEVNDQLFDFLMDS